LDTEGNSITSSIADTIVTVMLDNFKLVLLLHNVLYMGIVWV